MEGSGDEALFAHLGEDLRWDLAVLRSRPREIRREMRVREADRLRDLHDLGRQIKGRALEADEDDVVLLADEVEVLLHVDEPVLDRVKEGRLAIVQARNRGHHPNLSIVDERRAHDILAETGLKLVGVLREILRGREGRGHLVL